jgi:hypothetical protein
MGEVLRSSTEASSDPWTATAVSEIKADELFFL